MSNKFFKDYFDELIKVISVLEIDQIKKCGDVLWKAAKNEKSIFFIGNGGSASTASHLAADIGKNTIVSGNKIRFKTMALTDNVAWMTALGNDLAYEDIFVEQLINFGKKGDVLVAISGSGNSGNVVKAVKWAKKMGLITIGWLGFDGGKLKKMVDVEVLVPVKHYGFVEGIHSEIQHAVIEYLKIKMKEE